MATPSESGPARPARARGRQRGPLGLLAPVAPALASLLLLTACGAEPGQRVPAAGEVGVQVRFDLSAQPATVFDHPWPSDARADDAGVAELAAGLPNPLDAAVVSQLTSILPDLDGAPQVPVVLLRFDGAVQPRAPEVVLPAWSAATPSPLVLVDVDPTSPERGRTLPVVAQTLAQDLYVPSHVLALAPMPGVVLRPHTRYAAVVLRSANDDAGAPLGVPAVLRQLMNGGVPAGARGARAQAALASTWDTLETLGLPMTEVAAATAFTTADVVGAMAAHYQAVRAGFSPEISGWKLDPDDGAQHPRFCELHATLSLPQFQEGTPPFSTGGGLIPPGPPQAVRFAEVPVVVNLPKGAMPAGGYPVVLYFHGSGGLSTQVVDRGPVQVVGGKATPGLGPAHVLAQRGIATVGHALPLNPERHPGASDLTYLSLGNLAAYRGTMRQGTLEIGLLLDALTKAEIPPAALAGCLPGLRGPVRLATTTVGAMGQSQGAVYLNLVSAVEPRIGAVVPTGSGAHWSRMLLLSDRLPIRAIIAGLLGLDTPPTWLHPTLQVLQAAWEPVETLPYLSRVGARPLPGHPARHVFQPVGQGDSFYPEPLFDAMAVAYDHQQVGADVWPGMQQALTRVGRHAKASYPVANNRPVSGGGARTGVVAQFANDGVKGGHYVFQQLEGIKHQYGCFFQSYFSTGVARLPAPVSPVGATCE